jgi:hypothetical protein
MQGAEVAAAIGMDADVGGRQLVGEPAHAGKAVGRIGEQGITDGSVGRRLGDLLAAARHDADCRGAQCLDRRPRILEGEHGEIAIGTPAAAEQGQHQRPVVQQLARGPDAASAVLQGEVGQRVADGQALLGHAHHAQPVELVLDIGPLARRQRRHVPVAELEQRL